MSNHVPRFPVGTPVRYKVPGWSQAKGVIVDGFMDVGGPLLIMKVTSKDHPLWLTGQEINIVDDNPHLFARKIYR